MEESSEFVSLLVIVAIAALCPILADRIPKRIIPETVFLLIAGMAFGAYGIVPLIDTSGSIGFLSELGTAFLFLLAGYEIDPKMLTGHEGRRGLATWFVSFAIAVGVTFLVPFIDGGSLQGWAVAIMLTTTAIGTLMPILSERGILGTPLGDSIISYGTWGELCPILAIVLLLSTRATWQTMLILLLLVALCIFLATRASRARKHETALFRFLEKKANSTSQTFVRATIFILVLLVTISAIFDLDIVLGAFAAGFVLRYIIPEGNETLEHKLNGIGYGFFIPLFFVCSGAKIDVASVISRPVVLIAFILGLILIRAVPIFVSMKYDKQNTALSTRACVSGSFYCATALPLIVATSSVAVSAGAMTQDMAGTLVAAGAVTVFLMPLLAQGAYNLADAADVSVISTAAADAKPASSADAPNADQIPDWFRAEHAERMARAHMIAEAREEIAPWHIRLHVERMMTHGESSQDIARYIADEMGFSDDQARVDIVAQRVEYFRNIHKQEWGGAL